MTNLIKRKWLSLMAIAVMVAAVCLIGCGSDAAAPTAVNPTVGGDDTSSSGLDIVEWLEKASWKKYDAKIELNGENVTYSIVFHHQNEVSIYDNYNGNEELNYTWGYSSGHKITFFLTDRAIRFSGDTIIVNSYNIKRKNKRKCVKIAHSLFIFLCECIKIIASIYAISKKCGCEDNARLQKGEKENKYDFQSDTSEYN